MVRHKNDATALAEFGPEAHEGTKCFARRTHVENVKVGGVENCQAAACLVHGRWRPRRGRRWSLPWPTAAIDVPQERLELQLGLDHSRTIHRRGSDRSMRVGRDHGRVRTMFPAEILIIQGAWSGRR